MQIQCITIGAVSCAPTCYFSEDSTFNVIAYLKCNHRDTLFMGLTEYFLIYIRTCVWLFELRTHPSLHGHKSVDTELSYGCYPPPFLLAADKDNRPVHVVESEKGEDGNFATVAFTMVSVPLLLVLSTLLHICTDACASYACTNAT